MKKIAALIVIIVSAAAVMLMALRYKAEAEKKISNSMSADRRFIDVAADYYFLENTEAENVSLEALIEWSDEREGEKSWTRTLDPKATYKCELNRIQRHYEIHHPSLKDPLVWNY